MKSADSTAKDNSAASDLESVTHQLAALRDDMAKLAETVTGIAARRGRNMGSDIAQGLSQAEHYVERKGRAAEAQLESAVSTHPMMAIGLAAVAGILVGVLTRR